MSVIAPSVDWAVEMKSQRQHTSRHTAVSSSASPISPTYPIISPTLTLSLSSWIQSELSKFVISVQSMTCIPVLEVQLKVQLLGERYLT